MTYFFERNTLSGEREVGILYWNRKTFHTFRARAMQNGKKEATYFISNSPSATRIRFSHNKVKRQVDLDLRFFVFCKCAVGDTKYIGESLVFEKRSFEFKHKLSEVRKFVFELCSRVQTVDTYRLDMF